MHLYACIPYIDLCVYIYIGLWSKCLCIFPYKLTTSVCINWPNVWNNRLRLSSNRNNVSLIWKENLQNKIKLAVSACVGTYGMYDYIQSCSVEENLQHKIQFAVYARVYMECIIPVNLVPLKKNQLQYKCMCIVYTWVIYMYINTFFLPDVKC